MMIGLAQSAVIFGSHGSGWAGVYDCNDWMKRDDYAFDFL